MTIQAALEVRRPDGDERRLVGYQTLSDSQVRRLRRGRNLRLSWAYPPEAVMVDAVVFLRNGKEILRYGDPDPTWLGPLDVINWTLHAEW